MTKLPIPPRDAYIYEDDLLYVCLATYPLTEGHTVVVWKDKKSDLHLLNGDEYKYLMLVVEKARNALLSALNLKKVYLMYMDEANQVHWHLVPRYNEKGYDVLKHHPKLITDFSLSETIKRHWTSKI